MKEGILLCLILVGFMALPGSGTSPPAGVSGTAQAAEGGDRIAAAARCIPASACPVPKLDPGPSRPWRHKAKSRLVSTGKPHHRGRDLILTPGSPQTVIAKFSYGLTDKDLEDEEVDVYVLRGCARSWEKLGTAITTGAGRRHETVEGVDDHGGRVYFEIPKDKELGVGRNRVRLVVPGNLSTTDLFLDVVPPQTPVFVSDVDGTLTSSENVEFAKLLENQLPTTHPGAPAALNALAAKGYRPIYLTARPEWLVERTREFLDKWGFPLGIVHTSVSVSGAGVLAAAETFKRGELAMLAMKGFVPSYAFGNKPSDSKAYAGANINPPDHRIFFKIHGDFLGRRITDYTDLISEFAGIAQACLSQ